MKKVLLLLALSSSSMLSAQECQTTHLDNTSPLDTQLNNFSDSLLFISVTGVNVNVRDTTEKEIIKFRADTLSLANEELSKEGVSNWYANMINLNKLAFLSIKKLEIMDDTEAKRWAVSIVNNLVAGWLSRANALTMHERSHIEAAKAAGATSTWYATGDDPHKKITLGQLFLNLNTGTGRPSAHWLFDKLPSNEESASIAAAGLNQQIAFSEKISDEAIRSGKFHSTEAVHYLMNKLSYNIYYLKDTKSDLSDLKNYTESLARQGVIDKNQVDETMKQVNNYTILTTLMSGRTWDGVRANSEYIKTGKSSVDILSFETSAGKVTWPEFNTYLNSNSVSVKGSSSLIQANGPIHGVSIESSVLGKKSTEVALNTYIPRGRTYYSTTVRYNSENKFGAHLEAGLNLKDSKWSLFGGVDIDNGTLEGKRRNYNLNGKTDLKYYFGAQYIN